jgi:hypothetical protein
VRTSGINAPKLKVSSAAVKPNPSFQRKLESSAFSASKSLDSSFRWNDEQEFPATERP